MFLFKEHFKAIFQCNFRTAKLKTDKESRRLKNGTQI